MRWMLLLVVLLMPWAAISGHPGSTSEGDGYPYNVSRVTPALDWSWGYGDDGGIDVFPATAFARLARTGGAGGVNIHPLGGGSDGIDGLPMLSGIPPWVASFDNGVTMLLNKFGAVVVTLTAPQSQNFDMKAVPSTADMSLDSTWYRDVDDGDPPYREVVVVRTYRRAGEKFFKTIRRHQDANAAMNDAGYSVGNGQQ